MEINKRLAEVKNLITSIDLFEKEGWVYEYGISKENAGDRHDDLIARDIYTKTYPEGLKYEIVADRCQVRDVEDISSLPEINPGVGVDNAYFYRIKGVELLDGKVLSRTREDVVSEYPYLDVLRKVVNTISTLESSSKKLYTGKEKE